MNTAIILQAKELKIGMLVHAPGGFPSTGGLFSVVTMIYPSKRVRIEPYSWPIGHSSGILLSPDDWVVVLAKELTPVIV